MGLERGGMAKGMEVGIGKEENVAIFRRYMYIEGYRHDPTIFA